MKPGDASDTTCAYRARAARRFPSDARTIFGLLTDPLLQLLWPWWRPMRTQLHFGDLQATKMAHGGFSCPYRQNLKNCLLSAYGALSLSPDAFETAPAVEDVTVAGVRVPNPKKSFLGQSIAEPGSVCPFRFCCKSPHSRSYYCLELSLHKAYHIYIYIYIYSVCENIPRSPSLTIRLL